jgi:hypothetical protein
MTERWAFCDRCHRWFYPQTTARPGDHDHCPVCDTVPSMIRERRADAAPTAS